MASRITKLLVGPTGLPGESIPGQSVLELLGDDRVLIENHKGISEYGKQCITVGVHYGSVRIEGSGLALRRMEPGQLVIMGKIESIHLNRRQKHG